MPRPESACATDSAGDAVHRQRDRVDRRRDQVRARARGLDRRCERVAARALRVEADRQPGDVAQLGDELARTVRLQQRRRVVQQDARRAQLGQPLRCVDERLVAAAPVEEPRLELAARRDDRLGGLAQVVDVVQRIVQPEDLDAALGGARDEAPGEVAADRPRADEEAPAHSERERRRACARLERANALPGALDAAAHRRVEDAAAGDLEVREACAVEDLGEAQEVRRRHQAGERLLAEDADRRVDEARHGVGPYRDRRRALRCGRRRALARAGARRRSSSTSGSRGSSAPNPRLLSGVNSLLTSALCAGLMRRR